jgi:hypothetical protein
MLALKLTLHRTRQKIFLVLVLLLSSLFHFTSARAAAPTQDSYATLEDAAKALHAAARSGDHKQLHAVFGPSAKQLGSGDAVLAERERERFILAYEEKHALQSQDGKHATLVVGNNNWPFPVPLVKQAQGWRFDTAAGKEEILNRRIGRNELYVIQTLMAMVDAQQDYVANDHDGDGVREYAQKFISSSGKQDGLYWPAAAGQEASPLGPLAANAAYEGYSKKHSPTPYWGYYFRILTAQGEHAKGGAYSYMGNRDMIGGFAIIAYPAQYGASGIKSFIVNHDGKVFEKDLGSGTAKQAAAIKIFNPDSSWSATKDLTLEQKASSPKPAP